MNVDSCVHVTINSVQLVCVKVRLWVWTRAILFRKVPFSSCYYRYWVWDSWLCQEFSTDAGCAVW